MSRSIFGIIIGVLSLLMYATASCIIIYVLIESNDLRFHRNDNFYNIAIGLFIVLMISCLIMTLVSGLLIAGIIKKRHNLIRPWIYLSIVGIGLSIIILIISAQVAFEDTNILSSVIGIVVQILIWYPIFTLYKDIKAKSETGFLYDQQNVFVSPNHPFNTTYNSLSQNNI